MSGGGWTGDLFSRYFPNDGYTLTHEPSNAMVVRAAQTIARHTAPDEHADMLRMLGLVTPAPEDTTNGLYCRNGHVWSKNLTYDAEGSRRCRTCRTEQSVRSYRAGKA